MIHNIFLLIKTSTLLQYHCKNIHLTSTKYISIRNFNDENDSVATYFVPEGKEKVASRCRYCCHCKARNTPTLPFAVVTFPSKDEL